MDYKKALEDIKALFTKLSEEKVEKPEVEEVKLADESAEQAQEPASEPQVEFVSLSAFNEFKTETMSLIGKIVEMMSQNEKASVPEELAEVEVKVEKEDEVETVELETIEEVVTHTDEVEKEKVGSKYVNKQKGTAKERVFEALWGN